MAIVCLLVVPVRVMGEDVRFSDWLHLEADVGIHYNGASTYDSVYMDEDSDRMFSAERLNRDVVPLLFTVGLRIAVLSARDITPVTRFRFGDLDAPVDTIVILDLSAELERSVRFFEVATGLGYTFLGEERVAIPVEVLFGWRRQQVTFYLPEFSRSMYSMGADAFMFEAHATVDIALNTRNFLSPMVGFVWRFYGQTEYNVDKSKALFVAGASWTYAISRAINVGISLESNINTQELRATAILGFGNKCGDIRAAPETH